MVWLLPAAESARVLVIVAITWIVGIGSSARQGAGAALCARACVRGDHLDRRDRLVLPLDRGLGGGALSRHARTDDRRPVPDRVLRADAAGKRHRRHVAG